MSLIAPSVTLAAFLVFCRVGGCLMVVPGFASSRIPMQIRLYLAIAVSMALTPSLLSHFSGIEAVSPVMFASLAFTELLFGFTFGMICRVAFTAIHLALTLVAQIAGYASPSGATIEDGESNSALVNIFVLAATVLLFATNQHAQILLLLGQSFRVYPMFTSIDPGNILTRLTEYLELAFRLSLHLAAPYVALSIITNILIGITARVVPTVPIYLIAQPVVAVLCLLMLWLTAPEMGFMYLQQLSDGFGGAFR